MENCYYSPACECYGLTQRPTPAPGQLPPNHTGLLPLATTVAVGAAACQLSSHFSVLAFAFSFRGQRPPPLRSSPFSFFVSLSPLNLPQRPPPLESPPFFLFLTLSSQSLPKVTSSAKFTIFPPSLSLFAMSQLHPAFWSSDHFKKSVSSLPRKSGGGGIPSPKIYFSLNLWGGLLCLERGCE